MKPFDELNDMHASDKQKQSTYDYVMKHTRKTKTNWKSVSIVVLSCLCMCFFYVCYTFLSTPTTKTSPIVAYVSFDINPSFEMQLDEKNNVMNTIAYNKDGEVILSSVDVIGKYIDDAIDELLKNETYIRYSKDGVLEVSVYTKNDKERSALYQKINEHLGYNLEDTQYHCSNVNQEQYNDAMQHHTSAGKYRVITQILAYDPSYTLEKLKGYSMKELYELLATYIDTSDTGGVEGDITNNTNGNGFGGNRKREGSEDDNGGYGYHHGK